MSEGAKLENAGTLTDVESSTCSGRLNNAIAVPPESKVMPTVVNTGTIVEPEAEKEPSVIYTKFENSGTLEGKGGGDLIFAAGAASLRSGSVLKGALAFAEDVVSAANVNASGASLILTNAGILEALGSDTMSVGSFVLLNGTVDGAGKFEVTGSLTWTNGTMSGSGETLIGSLGTVSLLPEGGCELAHLAARKLVNDGTVTFGSVHNSGGSLVLSEGAHLENAGTFYDNSEAKYCSPAAGTIVEGASPAPVVVNTGTVSNTEASGAMVDVPFENKGTFDGAVGQLGWAAAVPVTLASASKLEGGISITQATVTMDSVLGSAANVQLEGSATLNVEKGSTVSLNSLTFAHALVSGAGNLNIVTFMLWETEGEMAGSGQTTLEGGATGEILSRRDYICEGAKLKERTFTNDGTVYFSAEKGEGGNSTMLLSNGARLDNNGVFNDNSGAYYCPHSELQFESLVEGGGRRSKVVNTGKFNRQGVGGFTAYIAVSAENWGKVEGAMAFLYQDGGGRRSYGCSDGNPSFPKREVAEVGGVCTGSGDLSESQTDFSIGGHGSGLDLTRTYNSQAAQEKQKSMFGYGWTGSYSTEHLYYETRLSVLLCVGLGLVGCG